MSDHVKVMMTMRSLGRIILALTHALFAVTSFTFIPVSSRKRYESTLFALRTMSSRIQIQQHVGSGSYGTVYLCNYTDDHGVHHKCIAKRAWNFDEMACLHPEAEKKVLIDKAKRADYYLSVEEHCLTKARDRSTSTHHIPTFLSTFDDAHYKWIVMNQISRKAENITNSPLEETAKSLKQVMDSDWIDQHSTGNRQSHHHLYMIQKELNLPQNSTFADTLDTVLLQLFHCVKDIHSINIVHRDLKPENLLVDGMRQSFVLIDFGSAADLDLTTQSMFGFNMIKKRIGLEDDSVVALSPIYAAPEQFVKVDRNPLSFDVFSIAMIFCQLLFNLLDERADAAFRQQLHESNYDLDTWIARELTTTIRPVGLEDALLYLDERRGLWHLLQDMIHPNPLQRMSSAQAYEKFVSILSSKACNAPVDGDFFQTLVSTVETCEMSLEQDTIQDNAQSSFNSGMHHTEPRPLHFVASFDRSEPLGLLLAEADSDGPFQSDNDLFSWKLATRNASPGDVFVRGLTVGGQASNMGIFRIGDRIRAIGEIPFVGGGFEGFLKMLEVYPKSSKTVKINFDRKLTLPYNDQSLIKTEKALNKVAQYGAWSLRGRRTAQEDAFVLHEILHPSGSPHILLAGVFDGHGGCAASKTASQVLPSLFALELQLFPSNSSQALVSAWNKTCETYRDGCSLYGSCVADYDPREGIIFAEHGAKDLVAGTTASIIAMDHETGSVTILNCGDSRTIIFSDMPVQSCNTLHSSSYIHFATRDHKPSDEHEMRRLREGKVDGYAQPECSLSRYWITVGDYQYAVSRSLEGRVATESGIISDADITQLNLSKIMPDGFTYGAVVVATDGLFDVMSDQEVASVLIQMMKDGMQADEASKVLCMLAHKKGSSDNISVIIVTLK